MRRREDWVKCAAFAIFAILVATTIMILIEVVGGRTVAWMLGIGCLAGVGYWWWCKRCEGRAKNEETEKREAPNAEYKHDMTREERRDLSKTMRELEEQFKKPAKEKPP